MEPPLSELVGSWADHLAEGPVGPAIIIDLSPRLSDAQREEVGEILRARWQDSPLTWEWVSKGQGRIDRLTVWFGGAADARSPASDAVSGLSAADGIDPGRPLGASAR